MKYRYIVFEGINGAGKETIMEKLIDEIKTTLPIKPNFLRAIGGTPALKEKEDFFNQLRKEILNLKSSNDEITKRFQEVQKYLHDEITKQKLYDPMIIMDRSWISNFVYQHYKEQNTHLKNTELLKTTFNDFLNNNPFIRPDLYVHIRANAEDIAKRITIRDNEQIRIQQNDIAECQLKLNAYDMVFDSSFIKKRTKTLVIENPTTTNQDELHNNIISKLISVIF